MNRLNGPYSYQNTRGAGWLVRDADGNLIAKCASSHTAQMIAANLTKCWEREKAQIEVAERVERE